jgi:hypothetical protein
MMRICTFGFRVYQVIHSHQMKPAFGGELLEEWIALITISCRQWASHAHVH